MSGDNNRGKLPIRFALGWGDFIGIATIVGVTTAGVIAYIGSVATDVNSLEAAMVEVQTSLARIETSVGSAPPVSVSTFFWGLAPADSPYSSFSPIDSTWEGPWSDLANVMSQTTGFRRSSIVPLEGDFPDQYDEAAFYYFAVVYQTDAPEANELRVEGWVSLDLDGYFAAAGHGPFGYSVFIPPSVVRTGVLSELSKGLEEVPDVNWDVWAGMLEDQ